jgi:hypothetical protein
MTTKRISITVVFLLALAFPLFGTTVPKMDLEALVNGSDRILQGKVEAMEVQMDADLNLPFTIVRVRVDDPICQRPGPKVRCSATAGDRRQTVFLKHVGGRRMTPNGPVGTVAAGVPQFHVGDNVILFLRVLPDGTNFQVVGLSQGKYDVVNEIAVANVAGMDLVDPQTGKILPTAFAERAPVDAFKAKIRELVK